MKRKIPYIRIYNTDFWAYTCELSNSDVGRLIRAMSKVALGYDKPDLPQKLEKIWEKFEESVINDISAYNKHILKSQKGGRSTGSTKSEPDCKQPKPEPKPIVSKEYTPDFILFWEAYPRRIDKQKSFKAYQAAVKKVSPQVILSGAGGYVKATTGTEAQYIKHPSSWLNGECWDNTPEDVWVNPHNQMPSPAGG